MPRIALLCFSFIVSLSATAYAQAPPAPAPYALQYFLTEPPPAIASLTFPDGARNPAIVKVRTDHPFWLGGRHGERMGKWILGAKIQILDVVSGSAEKGAEYFVQFIERRKPDLKALRNAYPSTPRMLALEYFVVLYEDSEKSRYEDVEKTRVLLGLPMDAQVYNEWETEHWAHERQRSRPGAQDR
jgi:hypothetical protein